MTCRCDARVVRPIRLTDRWLCGRCGETMKLTPPGKDVSFDVTEGPTPQQGD